MAILIDENFTRLENKLESIFQTDLKIENLSARINKERNDILNYFRKKRDTSLHTFDNFKLEYFRISYKSTNHTVKYLLDLKVINDLNLDKKIIYLNLNNSYEEHDLSYLNEGCSEIKVIPLNRNTIFLFIRTTQTKESLMKIVDKSGSEMYSRSIKQSVFYDQFMAFEDKFIFSELFDFDLNKYILEAYDNELNLMSFRKFKFMIKICCVQKNEIICIQFIHQKIIIFDFKFVELLRFDKQVMYGSIESNIMSNCLFSADVNWYYSVFFDYSKKMIIMNNIKKDTLTLEKTTEIDLSTNVKSLNWIAFVMNMNISTHDTQDSNSKSMLLVKTTPGVKLKMFSLLDGQYIDQTVNANIKKFNSLSVCLSNNLFFFDANKRKILFI